VCFHNKFATCPPPFHSNFASPCLLRRWFRNGSLDCQNPTSVRLAHGIPMRIRNHPRRSKHARDEAIGPKGDPRLEPNIAASQSGSHVCAYNQDTMQKEERERRGRERRNTTCRTAATQRVDTVAMAVVSTVLIAIMVATVSISATMSDCDAVSCTHLLHFATFNATQYVSCSILS